MSQISPFKSRKINHRFYKEKTDEVVVEYAKQYNPDFIFIGFARGLDKGTIQKIRDKVPTAILFGWDGDPWPENNDGRIELGSALDILFATNNGSFIEQYKQAGAKKCLFMPNLIDPDNDHRYQVDARWQSNLLWTGKIQHQAGIDAGETSRQNLLRIFSLQEGCKIYGCLEFPQIGGLDYLHAISGSKIGLSINAINTVPLYHSDRFTHYSACGTMVLAKRVPDTELLMQDKKHVCYFDSDEECLDLTKWYLLHEDARMKIANEGMQYCHDTYNSVQIAKYMCEVFERGQYEAPWGSFS